MASKKKLIIEVDGNIHRLPEVALSDLERTNTLQSEGIKIIRFTNKQVLYVNILYNNHKGSNPPRIGTIIAANSGRPGGACGNFNGTVDKIYPNHILPPKTQLMITNFGFFVNVYHNIHILYYTPF